MNIIVVDDRAENRYMLEALLTGVGYTVRSAANGAEALELVRAGSFDLIISDILMPVMDGFELCRIIRTDASLRRLPFIIYTATYTGQQDEDFARMIGADRFVLKPCDPDQLLEIVGGVLATPRPDLPIRTDPAGSSDLKLYNERLVRNLELKMQQLEQEARARHLAEDSLRQSERKLRQLFASIRDAIVVTDLEGRVIQCNAAFTALFGFQPEEALGLEAAILVDGPDCPWRVGPGEPPSGLRVSPFRRRDGSVFSGETQVFSLCDDDGAVIGRIGLVRDITGRLASERRQHELESQLQQARRLESLGRLASGIAHDFNNLLGVILGRTDQLLQGRASDQPPHPYLQQILQTCFNGRDLTQQLMAFSRGQDLDLQPTGVDALVAASEGLLRQLAGDMVTLVLRLGSGPAQIDADPGQLNRVLMNLVSNAHDAMPDGGTLEIGTGIEEAARQAVIRISDTGCGMAAEVVERVFEPFFTTKPKEKGTGLGLAIAYGIVIQHGGTIDVRSQPGRGTTFLIRLPLLANDASRRPVASS